MDRVRRGLRNLKFAVPLLSLLILVMAGCAKPPQMDIDAAKASIDAAVAAEAKDYAGSSLTAANDSWAALQTELQAQESKFALFRSYKKAKEMALVAEAQSLPEREVPDYVAPEGGDKATFVRVPTLDEVPYPVKMEPNLVVEFYSR